MCATTLFVPWRGRNVPEQFLDIGLVARPGSEDPKEKCCGLARVEGSWNDHETPPTSGHGGPQEDVFGLDVVGSGHGAFRMELVDSTLPVGLDLHDVESDGDVLFLVGND